MFVLTDYQPEIFCSRSSRWGPKLDGRYDIWCYLPVVATVRFKRSNDEPEQIAVAACCGRARGRRAERPGVRRALVHKLRAASRILTFRVRLDAEATASALRRIERRSVRANDAVEAGHPTLVDSASSSLALHTSSIPR